MPANRKGVPGGVVLAALGQSLIEQNNRSRENWQASDRPATTNLPAHFTKSDTTSVITDTMGKAHCRYLVVASAVSPTFAFKGST